MDEYVMGQGPLPAWLDAETVAWLDLGPGDRVVDRGTFVAPWHPGYRRTFRLRTSISSLAGV